MSTDEASNRELVPRTESARPSASTSRPAVLLVDHGDLAGLAAASVEADPAAVVIWHPQVAGPGAAGRRRAAASHADALGGADLQIGRPRSPLSRGAGSVRRGLADASVLLEAVERAVDLGCRRVVWAVAVGADPGRILAVGERAECVMDLVRGVPGAEEVAGAGPGAATEAGENASSRLEAIDLPLVDLEDDELADLAADSGMPLDGFWPCDDAADAADPADPPRPCGNCPGCRRWQGAFARRRLVWPWPVRGGVPLIETPRRGAADRAGRGRVAGG